MRIFSVLLLGGFFLFGLFFDDAKANTVTEQIQRRYSLINTMESNFTQVITHKESGAIKKRSGTLFFKKPMLVRWETKEPSSELIIVGKNELWNVFSGEQLAYKYPISIVDSSTSIIRVITGQSRLDQDFVIEEKGKEDNLRKITIYPNEPTQSLIEATLWIDEATATIKKITIVDFYSNTNEITFDQQKVGIKVQDSLFNYTPPKNYTVQDKREAEGSLFGN